MTTINTPLRAERWNAPLQNRATVYDTEGKILIQEMDYENAAAIVETVNGQAEVRESICNAHLHIHNQRTGYGNTDFLDLAEKHIKAALAAGGEK